MPSPRVRAVIEVRVRPPFPPDAPSLPAVRALVRAAADKLVRADMYLRTRDLTPALSAHVPCVVRASLTLGDDADPALRTTFLAARLSTHVYMCHGDDRALAVAAAPCSRASTAPSSSSSSDDDRDDRGSGSGAAAAADKDGLRDDAARALTEVAAVTELPAAGLEGAWDRLQLAAGTKAGLLGYVRAGRVLGKRRVDAGVVGWNGVVLLHGPPGTGKTTLCGALAQTVAVRGGMGDAALVEVRAERLLSKWFSESATRVAALFELVGRLARCREFVVVVVDEVETVGLSRKGRAGGAEPGDGIRVVNALLRGIDGLRGVGNCVVMCTSNLVDGIDEALVDRADVRVRVGEPGVEGRRRILEGVVRELRDKGVVKGAGEGDGDGDGEDGLGKAAEMSEGLSGRALRKLALVAMAMVDTEEEDGTGVGAGEFARAMERAAQQMQVKKTGGGE